MITTFSYELDPRLAPGYGFEVADLGQVHGKQRCVCRNERWILHVELGAITPMSHVQRWSLARSGLHSSFAAGNTQHDYPHRDNDESVCGSHH
jgi:hypothetical protein